MPIHGYLGGVISATAPSVTTAGASGVFTLEEQLQASAQNNWPGYQISRSVRTRASATAYFNRTPSGAGSLTTWTWSGWVKRGDLANYQRIISTTSGGSQFYFRFNNNNVFAAENAGTTFMVTTQVFRDPSAWYHIIFVWDTTNATSGDRARLYVNGSRVTDFSTMTNPSSSATTSWNSATAHYICGAATSENLDCYLTEVNFIDGQALTPTSFGATDAVTGVWNPIRYSGTYGTNGCYLNFKDATSTTTIGYDYSGNSNNWTSTQVSVTPGTTYDSMVDVPIGYGGDTGVGGEVRGNYCTFNPVYIVSGNSNSGGTWSNGNLQFTNGSTNNNSSMPTMALPTTGKWYWEIVTTAFGGGSNPVIGICDYTGGANGLGGWYYRSNGNKYDQSGNGFSYGATWTTNDVIGVAVDMDAATLTFYKNGVSQGVAWTSITSNVSGNLLYPYVRVNVAGDTYVGNFGQRAFAYTAPSGYKCLCTQNLPTPTISNGANYMAASLYTGTGASQTVSNAVNSISFQPDLVWIKSRSAATDHKWTDSVRGTTKALVSNSSAAETTDSTGLTAFGSSGFTVGANTTYNNSGATYVGWQWKASGSTVSNTAGSITSTVSANTTAGFSVVSYTGTIANATVGHGLGVAPQMIIARNRTNVVNWIVYHVRLTSASYYLTLDETNGQTSNSIFWQGVAPTSTVFSLGANSSCNGSTSNIAYCFAPITGYSAFGSYTGNGSTDGPFVFTGFRPRWIMVKRTDSAANWYLWDTARDTYNVAALLLVPNSSTAESSSNALDILSNGFKWRATGADWNASGGTFIYAAFAENPFNISRAR
jgi:hypothetical protein